MDGPLSDLITLNKRGLHHEIQKNNEGVPKKRYLNRSVTGLSEISFALTTTFLRV
jgi:hypothetical protein